MTTSLDLQTVELKIEDGVGWIILNRPEALNAWTTELGQELISVLDRVAADPEVRALVITGAVLTPRREAYDPLLLRVRTVPKPVIAAVNGAAVGIGCSLTLACDKLIASESAYFLLAFVNIGLALDGGASILLPHLVGHASARRRGRDAAGARGVGRLRRGPARVRPEARTVHRRLNLA